MRPIPRKTSRGQGQATASVSLMPFLAVLTCTMGALILLLVVVTWQARARAAELAAADVAERDDNVKKEQGLTQWRIEQLRASLEKTRSQVADARLELGHLEDHARRLRDQIARIEATFTDLEHVDGQAGRRRGELEAELGQVKALIAEARRRLAEAEQAAQQPRSYAVVPYRGPNQTYRRPIYVECGPEAIVIQPEGIMLTEADFAGPLGPGNPLASALRAAREHMLAQGGLDPEKSGEPYPLLLVRPQGIAAYYAAQAAMESWASEFGYELIGEDWKLEFQPADSQLARVMQEAVDTARARQKRLAAAAPNRYAQPEPVWYRAASGRGGTVVDGGPAGASRSSRPAEQVGFGGDAAENEASGSEAAANDGPRLNPGEWRPGEVSADEAPAAESGGTRVESLARHRGRNWGLPDAAGASVPISRPIRVECQHDRLVIVPEGDPARSRAIPLRLLTEESIDEFVSAVWEHMHSWGIAGNGMYWRPILSIEVAADAERRYAELNTLLEGSGLVLERRN